MQNREKLAVRGNRQPEVARHVDSRLKYLHDFVDQQRVPGEDRPRDDGVQYKCANRNQRFEDLESPGPITVGCCARRRYSCGVRSISPPDRRNDGDAQANGRAIAPPDETVRIRAVYFTAGKPIGEREKSEDRERDRDQERDRSISKMRFCKSAGLTPGTLAACASDSGRRAASF